ncbi:MAG: hypothetical protein ABIJ27_01715 [Candidatus Omnitrophota bacterium]
MKALCVLIASAFLAICVASGSAFAAEKILYSFEDGVEGWEIPEWSLEKDDHVTQSIESSRDFSKDGRRSLEVKAAFPGKRWTAAIVEVAEYFDWSNNDVVSCDIYLPKDAPSGLKAKMILTVGNEWKFTEMARSVKLVPGEWTTVAASLADGSTDWRKVVADQDFRGDIRKVDVRVESNKKPEFAGSFYIDSMKVTSK